MAELDGAEVDVADIDGGGADMGVAVVPIVGHAGQSLSIKRSLKNGL